MVRPSGPSSVASGVGCASTWVKRPRGSGGGWTVRRRGAIRSATVGSSFRALRGAREVGALGDVAEGSTVRATTAGAAFSGVAPMLATAPVVRASWTASSSSTSA